MNPLIPFQQDTHTREAVKAFMLGQLEEMTIEKVFANQPTTGIYEAKELIEKMFSRLEELYAPKKKVVHESSR